MGASAAAQRILSSAQRRFTAVGRVAARRRTSSSTRARNASRRVLRCGRKPATSPIAAAIPTILLLTLIATGKAQIHIAAVIAVIVAALIAIVGFGMPSGLAVRAVSDRAVLRGFLETDRLLAAYALCDLEDREFAKTRWGGAFDGDELVAIALEYSGLTPQPLFVMGRPEGIEAILRDIVPNDICW